MAKIIYIISGHSDSGKTTWIKNAVKFLKENNITVGGVIAPGVWENDKKTGIDSILLPDEDLVHLAVRKPDFAEGYSRKWKFNDEVIEKINNHLGQLDAFEYVVIDEIGPLEIMKHQGFTNALKILREGKIKNVIVALRPSLTNRLQEIIHKDYKIFIIDAEKDKDVSAML